MGKFPGKIIVSAVLLGTLFGVCGAGSMKAEKEVNVEGRVYLMGHEPFTEVAIETPEGKVYALTGEPVREIRRLQGKRLRLTGRFAGESARKVKRIEVQSFEVLEGK
ncbi:MAG: hypothetical protein HY697_02315 [Deltaproteobacteria bacterium]|nr:hypothetical protein [Deltaproteobacteria bacterium]